MKNIAKALTGVLVSTGFLNLAEAAVSLRPMVKGCPSSGYSRLVNVSSDAAFGSALSSAMPGDQIRLAAGSYGAKTVSRSGTASAPITICGMYGSAPVISGGTFKVTASNLVISGLVFEGGGDNNNVGLMGTTNLHFTHNEVRNGKWHAGIAVDTTANVEISYNYIHSNGLTRIDHGIYYRHQAGANIIANNLIVGNRGRGISMHSNGGEPVSDTTVVHNTMARNGSTGLLLAVNAGTRNVIANNILSQNGDIEGYKQLRIVIGPSGIAPSGNSILNNIVYSSDSSRQGIEIQGGSNTLSQNLMVDPQFVGSSDYHLRSASPAISLGLASYMVRDDKDGLVRDSSPDSGAFEFGGSSSTPAPTPTATPAPTATPVATPAPTATPASTPAPLGSIAKIQASQDTFINSAYPTLTRGLEKVLKVDNSPQIHSLLKFVVSGSSGKMLKSAKLRLVPAASAKSGGDIRRELGSWSDATTWKTAPAMNSVVLARQGATVKGQAVLIDVTSAVSGDGTYSFRITNSVDDGTNYDYYSRESGAAVAPELVLEFAN